MYDNSNGILHFCKALDDQSAFENQSYLGLALEVLQTFMQSFSLVPISVDLMKLCDF